MLNNYSFVDHTFIKYTNILKYIKKSLIYFKNTVLISRDGINNMNSKLLKDRNIIKQRWDKYPGVS